jgi:glycosyltransferase involved in cell wall biosynthesis
VYREKFDPDTWYKTVSYWPVDSELKENWVTDSVALADRSVAYTNFGKEEVDMYLEDKKKIDVIYHGTDTENFHPISAKEKAYFRKQFFQGKLDDEAFVVSVVARNQMRKDLPRVMKIFKEFQKRRPQSILYLHAKESDAWGSLREYARQVGLEYMKDYWVPGNFNENQGFPVEALNKIYNVADVHLSASLGEGWGLPLTEAMAAKTINIAPLHTSIPELFNVEGMRNEDIDMESLSEKEIRGIPVKAGSTSSEFVTFGPEDYERFRPLMNVDDAVSKLMWVYENPDKVKEIEERAYEWVQQHSWLNMAKK